MKPEDLFQIELARLTITQNVMTECLFGALSELLKPEDLKNLQLNYYETLQRKLSEGLSPLSGIVEHKTLVKQMFDIESAVQARIREIVTTEV